ncbi:Mechanosensitive ion channel protein 10 [Hondaea fermentalgiana]|uniref:Mechanosensitive ion channel protein 10 n=1 Tax=Hondaea fermentalgiana TaxID=2315210 RepID=A0A2R5GNI9_9STRA|nr:Mechanosensitive ion channel protein 10 [Hondaea fermentalgiana]|eukprot:GBG32450.1 Mechanosensitive ion channel protein 10 [Hondaea fermentalgiana]
MSTPVSPTGSDAGTVQAPPTASGVSVRSGFTTRTPLSPSTLRSPRQRPRTQSSATWRKSLSSADEALEKALKKPAAATPEEPAPEPDHEVRMLSSHTGRFEDSEFDENERLDKHENLFCGFLRRRPIKSFLFVLGITLMIAGACMKAIDRVDIRQVPEALLFVGSSLAMGIVADVITETFGGLLTAMVGIAGRRHKEAEYQLAVAHFYYRSVISKIDVLIWDLLVIIMFTSFVPRASDSTAIVPTWEQAYYYLIRLLGIWAMVLFARVLTQLFRMYLTQDFGVRSFSSRVKDSLDREILLAKLRMVRPNPNFLSLANRLRVVMDNGYGDPELWQAVVRHVNTHHVDGFEPTSGKHVPVKPGQDPGLSRRARPVAASIFSRLMESIKEQRYDFLHSDENLVDGEHSDSDDDNDPASSEDTVVNAERKATGKSSRADGGIRNMESFRTIRSDEPAETPALDEADEAANDQGDDDEIASELMPPPLDFSDPNTRVDLDDLQGHFDNDEKHGAAVTTKAQSHLRELDEEPPMETLQAIQEEYAQLQDSDKSDSSRRQLLSHMSSRLGNKVFFKDEVLQALKQIDSAYNWEHVWSQHFDPKGSGLLTWPRMRTMVLNFYEQRYNLSLSLQDSNAAIKSMDVTILSILLVIVTLISLTFFTTDIASTLTSFATVVVGYSFIFGNSAMQSFENIIFLFGVHPYDVGDTLLFNNNRYTVSRIRLLTTDFVQADGAMMRLQNSYVATLGPIFNLDTSRNHSIGLDLYFPATDVRESTVKAIRNSLNEFVKANPSSFEGAFFTARNFLHPLEGNGELPGKGTHATHVHFVLWITYAYSFNDAGRIFMDQTQIITHLSETLATLGLSKPIIDDTHHGAQRFGTSSGQQ